ncbi:hypothetical protein OG909_28340 [Streptomyces sp. NBC_01754]|uniref:hypothetical protein n=1 Tax=Streptomyces sp. NBC_01754 TaxID=2975930 RepID=UPI002DDAD3CA|nr:hypothetical protein [Streptomyces sp. NBC_01754]WSC95883.1 hypothetical protein OG909_28340 [Streptomyces sp. NBC_01754]
MSDAADGRKEAEFECPHSGWSEGWEHPIVTSPNSRYLASGHVVFDPQEEKGLCLSRDGDRKNVTLASIADSGMGYGTVEGSDTERTVHVQVPFDTGEPEVLGAKTVIPVLQGDDFGIMADHTDAGGTRISVRALR